MTRTLTATVAAPQSLLDDLELDAVLAALDGNSSNGTVLDDSDYVSRVLADHEHRQALLSPAQRAEQDMRDSLTALLLEAQVDPAFVYAASTLGYIVTSANQHRHDSERIAQWREAVIAYREMFGPEDTTLYIPQQRAA